jgi:DNA-binding transcriptional LysR family regulator
MLPSHNDLIYFVEVASTLNLSRAAERLGVSQPSLSLSIQRLEHQMGISLLMRSKRGVTLTPAGTKLSIHVKRLLQDWEKLRAETIKSHESVMGQFTIGCHPSVAIYSLPHFLPQLFEKYPELEIQLLHDLSRKITEAVVSWRVDLGIVVNPLKHPDLVIKNLTTDVVTLWKGPGHSKLQDPISGQGVLICDPDLLQTQSLMKQMKKNKFLFQRIISTPNLELISSLTEAGAGIGILPTRVATGPTSKKLSVIKDAPTFEDEICLIYRTENRSIRALKAIIDELIPIFD